MLRAWGLQIFCPLSKATYPHGGKFPQGGTGYVYTTVNVRSTTFDTSRLTCVAATRQECQTRHFLPRILPRCYAKTGVATPHNCRAAPLSRLTLPLSRQKHRCCRATARNGTAAGAAETPPLPRCALAKNGIAAGAAKTAALHCLWRGRNPPLPRSALAKNGTHAVRRCRGTPTAALHCR